MTIPGADYIREWSRQKLNVPAEVEVVLASGRVFTSGKAMVRDISFQGARLGRIVLRKPILPARPFKIRLSFRDRERRGIAAMCRPVRFGQGEEFELGVEFEEFWADEQDGSPKPPSGA